jgi:hypothetical protein
MSRQTRVQSLALAAALLPMAACSPTIKKPQLLHPGPAPFQRANAEQFDPYPQNDVGPEIVGGRPPDYAIPRDEVTRANQFRASHQASAAPILVPQTPIFAPTLPPAAPPPVEYRY